MTAQSEDVPRPEALSAARLTGSAVNPRTLLATDYLNHFNEAIMLLEMAPSMEECIEDLQNWRPKAYEAHFRDSGFKDRLLCIEAYAYVDPAVKARFRAVIGRLGREILEACAGLAQAQTHSRLAPHCAAAIERLHPLIDMASGIINGASDMQAIDEAEHIDATQSAIAALFDEPASQPSLSEWQMTSESPTACADPSSAPASLSGEMAASS
jgi:hypothetical protein